MPTKAEVQAYCERFNLTFVDGAELDEEEWEGISCAGFEGDPMYVGTVIYLERLGRCFVTTTYADGIRHMEDDVTEVDADQLFRAVTKGTPIHAT
jgi:hypothetical protein